MQRYSIHVPDADLSDLRERLRRARWPDAVSGAGWAYGTDLDYLRDLVEYWAEGFDWRAREAELNRFPHFLATIDGTSIHYLHQRGTGPAPLPLVLTHGWPGSFLEFLGVLGALADPASAGGDPADAFDVVVPSLPGYGFSERPAQRGFGRERIADLWVGLMTELGYERFALQGGDIGAGVSVVLAQRHPERALAAHLNYIPYSLGRAAPDPSPGELEYFAELERWYAEEGGYWYLQRTRPQTLAMALHDSPVGLAAWLVEKYRAWSDCGGDLESRFGRDEILTHVALYWLTGTIHSSMRLYFESRLQQLAVPVDRRLRGEYGILRLAREAPFPPREHVERSYDVRRWTEHPVGGHFAALEEPEVFVADVRAFFRRYR